MEPTLILADQIMTLLRNSGMTKKQARAAIEIAGSVLFSADDIRFQDLPEAEEPVSSSEG